MLLVCSVAGLVFVDGVTFSDASIGQERKLQSHKNVRKRREEASAMKLGRQIPS